MNDAPNSGGVSGTLRYASGHAFAFGPVNWLDHDNFGSNRSKIINVIASNTLEHDVTRKPLRAFRHHALGFAATPTFAVMALLTGVGDTPDILCSATQAGSPLSGMAVMYLLMSAFHSSPWLKMILEWRNGVRR